MLADSRSPRLAVACACLLAAACTGDAPTPADVDAVFGPGSIAADRSSAEVAQALNGLRAKTAEWHNPEKAWDAGYTVPVGCSDERTEGLSAAAARGMGYHTLNFDLLFDGEAHLLEPELIVYALEPESGEMKLAGFDYFIPGVSAPDGYPAPDAPDYPGQPPVLQGLGTPLTWNDAHGGWIIHAWPWMHNPDGMFENFNPSVALCECEINPTTPLCFPS